MIATSRISSWLKDNYIALLLAVVAGFLTVLPHFLAVHDLSATYRGIPFFLIDNEDYYLARIHEITDGHGFVGSSFFLEYKDSLPVVPSIGEYLYVLLALLTNLSLPHTLLVAKFLFPFLLFMLIYTFIRRVSDTETEQGKQNILGALAGASIIVMGYDLINYHLIYERLMGAVTETRVLSPWSRPVNPITGGLFLFSYLHLIWMTFKERTKSSAIAAGILIALSLGYIFAVGIELTLLGLLLMLAMKWKDVELIKRLSIVGAVGLGLASIYWLSVLHTLTKGGDLAGKNGLMLMHTPLPNKVLIAAFIVIGVIVVIARRHKDVDLLKDRVKYQHLWFMFALLVSGIIVLNQQIITGMTVWPYHFVQYTNPIAIIAVIIFGFSLFGKYFKQTWKILMLIAILISVYLSAWSATTYVYAMDEFRAMQSFAPAYAWLNANAKKDCVVLTVDDDQELLTGFLPGFTSCNVYSTKNFVSASVPSARITHNFFVLLRMRGVTDESIDSYLNEHQDLVLRYYYKDYQELFGLVHNDRIKNLIPSLSRDYKIFFKLDFSAELKHYQLDYLLSKEVLSKDVEQDLLGHIKPVFKDGTITIYSFQ